MIRLKSSRLEAWVLPFGATLAGLWYKGTARSLVLGFAGVTGYKQTPICAGAVVGPIANRISHGTVLRDGQMWQMPINEQPHSLHSGPNGLHTRTWEVVSQSSTSVSLRLKLPDGDTGLPGERRFDAQYTLTDDGTLDLRLSAMSDADTFVNLAHHPYWTLDLHETVGRHTLRIHADRYLPTGQDLIPTGDVTSVEGSPYDFQEPRLVPVDQSLDACLCLSLDRRPSPRPAATLTGPTGLRLDLETTEPGLQLYNGAGLPVSTAPMHPGQRLGPFAGLALEPQGWPDAPNHPHFPSISLRANAVYRQHTRYRISRES